MRSSAACSEPTCTWFRPRFPRTKTSNSGHASSASARVRAHAATSCFVALRQPSRLLCRVRGRRLAHPRALLVRRAPARDALRVARAVARDDALRTRPSRGRRSRGARAARSSAARGRAGSRRGAAACGTVMSTKRWRSSSLRVPLDPHAIDCAVLGESSSGGPNIISDGHHQRSTASCTIAPLRFGAAHHGQQQLVALALVEGLLLADADHRARVRAVGAAAQRHLVADRRAVDEPADHADVGEGGRRIVEDRRVLLPALDQLAASGRARSAPSVSAAE